MKQCVLCSKTDRPNEYAFDYQETEGYGFPTATAPAGVLMREKFLDKNYDKIDVTVESDIAPIIIELMYDCLEEEKSFKVIV